MIRRLPWANLALLAASLLFAFLLLELAARTLSWHMGKGFWSRPDSFASAFFVTYDPAPPLLRGGTCENRAPGAGPGADSDPGPDSHPDDERFPGCGTFRDGQSVPLPKPAGALRVICLGGSTTVNARNAEGLQYSRELQKSLRARFPGVELHVLNAGGDAFSTAHSLTNLSLRLVDFEPDVITVYHAINDLTASQFGTWMEPDYSNKYLDDAFLAYEHRGGLGGTIFRLSRGAQMVKWRLGVLRRTLERSSRGAGVLNPERGPELFERNLRSIVAIARAHGVEPLFATQAHADGLAAENGRFASYNEITRSVARELDVALADVAPALDRRREQGEDLFLDPVHLSSDGVRAVAAELLPALTDLLLARQAADEPTAPRSPGPAATAVEGGGAK